MVDDILIITISGSVLLVVITVIIFIMLFKNQKKHNRHIIIREQLQSQFQQTLLQSQLEIQEQTLKNISQEIHDNIGQMLSLAKLNLGTAEIADNENARQKVENAHQLVSKSITDLRNLSRSLDTDYVSEQGLQASIAFELELIGKTGQHKTQLQVEGQSIKPDAQKELILFRIVQECLNNIIKHAQATKIEVLLQYTPTGLSVSITDNGTGFNTTETENGLGLRNMHNRARLIGATFSLSSTPGTGTRAVIDLPV